MAKPSPDAGPAFSVVIAIYNDWEPLDRCLRSLSEQTNSPTFEVIVVDDGSHQPAPSHIRNWAGSFPLQVLTETHAGIAAARNRGIRASRGSTLLFMDADCKAQPDCLSKLDAAMSTFPGDDYFQLHLVGDCSRRVGKAE